MGEIYGGFRGPRLARGLVEQGAALSGMLLVPPILDYNNRSIDWEPYTYLTRLPTMAAAHRSATTRDQVADAEAYATGEYFQDFLRGMGDPAAVARMAKTVAEMTGLPPELTVRRGGRIDWWTERREREPGRIASSYDLSLTGIDPLPTSQFVEAPDAVTDALNPVLTSAAVSLYADRLLWRPEGAPTPHYELLNGAVNRAWTFNGQGRSPVSVPALRIALAFDPRLQVIMHGLYDLVTPYYASKMILDQSPPAVAGRARLMVLPDGHMFCTRDASRVLLRDQGATLAAGTAAP